MLIITGASGGIGAFLVENLCQEHEIIGTYYSNKPSSSNHVEYFQVDACDMSSIERFVLHCADRLQNVILINLAGVSINGMGHKMTEDVWDQVVGVNLKGAFLMSRAVLPFMREQSWGRIINVSSVVGQLGVPGTSAYSASKAGLLGLTRTMAAENATKNITVNALTLGYFDVGMINSINTEFQDQIRAGIPMMHFGDPKNIALGVRFLIDCDYITGTSLNINGGLY